MGQVRVQKKNLRSLLREVIMKKRWRNIELDLDRSYTKRKEEWLPSIIKEHYCQEATGLQSAFPEDFPAF